MSAIYDRVVKCLECVRAKTDFVPKVALVLGSGLGDYGNEIQVEAIVDYHDIEGFPVSTVPGHSGRFIFGYVEDVPVVCMQGRVHYYEGYAMEDVVLPVRLMKLMGAEVFFVTNAAGGANEVFNAGDFMMITDQISQFVPSPLAGPNPDEFGTRFPDMSEIYNKDLRVLLREAADELNITLYEGTYLQTSGPNFETPAEVRFFRSVGADAVGMSTAVETIAANHMGMKICGITFISNPAAGLSKNPLTHEEVQEAANEASKRFKKLVTVAIRKIGKQL
ncbi:MAG: purine-nucleoside phosphorylase [Lachnospiraceae bacterium]|nr:purine-nucleoside phosphorylase [Lachnospiraceae bacterium]MBQ6312271.1 purine-nucleoside phosphorylase [Lachnospiraceae bacterium]MBQ6354178.1 purine-nucleoside phosphorylase [Lachnospiraceae bacterium]MBR2752444.1 purine-nucleoside phosphorylase [Lachnospiraceae bacterium]